MRIRFDVYLVWSLYKLKSTQMASKHKYFLCIVDMIIIISDAIEAVIIYIIATNDSWVCSPTPMFEFILVQSKHWLHRAADIIAMIHY